jgi:hypothetical protein
MITSPSGKRYVGQTEHMVWRMYKYSKMHCNKQAKLYNSFKKYGWDNHQFEILQECSLDGLNDLEVHYISTYATFNNDSGLNLVSGGNRPVFSDETREKIRIANVGKKYSDETNYKKGAALRGKNISDEVKLKMSIGQKRIQTPESRQKRREGFSGKNNPMFGKKWTDEQKKAHGDKVRGNKPMLGKKHSEETKAKMRGLRGKYKNRLNENSNMSFGNPQV